MCRGSASEELWAECKNAPPEVYDPDEASVWIKIRANGPIKVYN